MTERSHVDIGGYRFALKRAGVGSPTVVLDAGMGQAASSWDPIFDAVAQFTQVVAYDRAGQGESDPAPRPRAMRDVVEDLHRLLVSAAIPAPYVLVGHSFAGLTIRLYAHEYPSEVAGLVFVEASHPEQWSREAAALSSEAAALSSEAAALSSEAADEGDELQKLRAFFRRQIQDPSANPEGIDIRDTRADSASAWAAGTLGDRPIAVLSARRSPLPPALSEGVIGAVQESWHDLHRELARLSSNSRHVMAEHSGHFIQRDEPVLVIDAIRQVVDAVRSGP